MIYEMLGMLRFIDGMLLGAIAASDILFYHPSVPAEGASHGGTSTTSEIATSKNALWDDVSGAEASAGDTEYRKIFIGLGTDVGSDVLSSPVLWVASTTPAGDEIEIKTVTAGGDSSNVRSDITSVTDWTTPTIKSDGLSLANLETGDSVGVWIRRAVPASTSGWADDAATLRLEGDV